MQRTFALVAGSIARVDCVIEVLDARIPVSSSSSVLRRLARGKERVILLNKADLADPGVTGSWIDHFMRAGHPAISVCTKAPEDKEKLLEALGSAKERKRQRLGLRHVRALSFRVMVAGLPNVGKSSVVNLLAGTRHARAGARPGLTRGQQWVRCEEGIELLDTPGVFVPDVSRKPPDSPWVLKLGLCGILPLTMFDAQIAACYLLRITGERALAALGLDASVKDADPAGVLARLAEKGGFLVAGGELDIQRAARFVIHEFGKGSLGKFTLELPEEE